MHALAAASTYTTTWFDPLTVSLAACQLSYKLVRWLVETHYFCYLAGGRRILLALAGRQTHIGTRVQKEPTTCYKNDMTDKMTA